MRKLFLLLPLLALTGCEQAWIVPPAKGTLVDARTGKPIARAQVTRVSREAPAQTTTDASGHFRLAGKRATEAAYDHPIAVPASYRIEAAGYQPVETNTLVCEWDHISRLKARFGAIPLEPK